jgi:hypothetical protein
MKEMKITGNSPPFGGSWRGATFLNASQIAAKLADRAKLNINDGTINKLGKALKKHNFTRLMRQGKPVYAVKEFTYEEVDQKTKKSKNKKQLKSGNEKFHFFSHHCYH